jgi:hypothetical protein
MTITHSLIADNQALGSGGGGGGINTGRPLTLADSIIRGNSATYALRRPDAERRRGAAGARHRDG